MEYINLILLLWLSISWRICSANHEEFIKCMSLHSSIGYIKSFKSLHTPGSSSYSHLLQSAQQNPRWLNSTYPKPQFIITPYSETEIQAAIVCSKKHDLQIRVKSGGHDYEGLSYLCKTPFVVIDLVNLRLISIDLEEETAWVQSGATVGELYYSIAQNSRIHGFPAGICPSVGVGGHFSGGGLGTMTRKYGLAADNIIDAYLIDADARILDREAMGKDLFWAIRGGGGASFGIIVAWKIKLVQVPPIVTVFTIRKKLDLEGTKLVYRWQHIANNLPKELFIRVIIQSPGVDSRENEKTVKALFNSLFLGPVNELLPIMDKSFPELALQAEDCSEMSWIESILYFSGYERGQPLEVLFDRTVQDKSYFKAKSDFVEEPIPESAWEKVREMFQDGKARDMILDPFGGRMDEISESELPFPHRKGNLYNIQYLVQWLVDGEVESEKHINWIKKLHRLMKPHVSRSPRAAYVNYRDLDLGMNLQDNTSYSEAMIWGRKYFKGNFKILAKVKSRVDPDNFFRDEQSIPLLHQQKICNKFNQNFVLPQKVQLM